MVVKICWLFTNPILFGFSKEEKETDDKLKEEQLRSLGWNILRFSDGEIKRNLTQVISRIKISLLN